VSAAHDAWRKERQLLAGASVGRLYGNTRFQFHTAAAVDLDAWSWLRLDAAIGLVDAKDRWGAQ